MTGTQSDMVDCPFCNNNRKKFLLNNSYDVKQMYFYEDADFSISPDLSPLVTGHLLIIPHEHFASFGEIENASMLSAMRTMSEKLLGSDDLLFFEHGAVNEGKGGASVDHAHLHVMPRPPSLDVHFIDSFICSSGFIKATKIKAPHPVLQRFFKQKQPYIFYELMGEKYAYPVDELPHQFLRKMLQPYCAISFNWRETYSSIQCHKNVSRTIEFVKNRMLFDVL